MDPALQELLRASAGPPDGEVEAVVRLADPGAQLTGMRIVARFGPIVTCRLRRDAIVAVWQDPLVISVKASRAVGPEPEPLLAEPQSRPGDGLQAGDLRRPPGLALTGRGVVVGIVDWHCGFDHVNFRRADGTTRLSALWDQRPGRGDPPQPYGYGTLFDAAAIDRALLEPDPYTALGYRPADAGHGTHVMDIAAGGGRAGPAGLAPDAQLVFVHVADRGTSGLADLGDSCRILEAVDFIHRTAGPRPWVINCSMGRHGGPHDGRTLCELAFDWLLSAAPGRFLALSTGNYFNKPIHACGRLTPGETRTLRIVTDEADETPNELEIWYDGDDEFAVRVESPTGCRTRWVGLCEQADIEEDGEVVGRIYHRCWDPNNHDHHIDIFLDPTAPAGEWAVTLQAVASIHGCFHAWLERDEACPHCQAHFVAADANATTTTGTLANGHLPLTVGAYNAHSPRGELTSFTSAGTTRDGRCKPDLVAPGSSVLAARSSCQTSAATSTLLMRMSGTSMAAPHVTGAVALCLQADPALSATQIRQLVQHSAIPIPEADPARVGAGRLDVARLEAAVLAREPTPTHQHRVAQPSKPGKEAAMSTPEAEWSRWAGLDADRLYRELVYRRTPPPLTAAFDIVALPGEAPRTPLQSGDLLVRVVRGYPRLGHVAVVSDPTLIGHDRLATASGGAERGGPGFYATVTEAGAVPHTAADRFARLILYVDGRMPDSQLLLRGRPEEAATPDGEDFEESERPVAPQCIEILKGAPKTTGLKVAIVGGGFAGLMAARTLCREGVKVTVFEARQEVGGRVVSNKGKYSKDFSTQPVFSPGRITEFGAELVGSIHTRWCELAKYYGLALISRMDTDLYRGQKLNVKLTLDKALTMDEIRALDKAMDKVQFQIAQTASGIHDPSQPWLKDAMSEKDKQDYDNMSVADALKNKYGVKPGGRLWKAFEWLLGNNNVKPLEQLNFLGLLCLVKGGQSGTIAGKPEPGERDERLMGYWKELEIYRCADGCQTLAVEMQKDATARGCEVRLLRAVTGLHLVEERGKLKVQLASRRVLLPGYALEKGKPNVEDFDYVILAIPPTVWSGVNLTSGNTPTNPKHTHHVALMDCGDAVKFFSNVGTRFWIRDKAAAPQAQGAAPMGGSPTLGLVWEGTDNQTQTGDQGIVLSVFAGGPSPTRPANEEAFKKELTKLYSNYPRHLQKKLGTTEDWTKFANWPQEPFIRTGYASPGRGQVLTIGKLLYEPFAPFFGRLLFAGEHTEMGYFGYMEGALRSGERAARRLIQGACTKGVTIPGEPTLTPASAPAPRLAAELVTDQPSSEGQPQTMQSRLAERGDLNGSIEEPERGSQIMHARHAHEAPCCAAHELGTKVEDRPTVNQQFTARELRPHALDEAMPDGGPDGGTDHGGPALQSVATRREFNEKPAYEYPEKPDDPAPATTCGFHGPKIVTSLADVRTAVVDAAVSERAKWFVGGSLQVENTRARHGDLVRYFLAGNKGSEDIRPDTLLVAMKAASTVNYDGLRDADIDARVQEFANLNKALDDATTDLLNRWDDFDWYTEQVNEAQKAITPTQAVLDTANATLSSAATAVTTLARQVKAGTAQPSALNAAKAAHASAVADRDKAADALKDAKEKLEAAKNKVAAAQFAIDEARKKRHKAKEDRDPPPSRRKKGSKAPLSPAEKASALKSANKKKVLDELFTISPPKGVPKLAPTMFETAIVLAHRSRSDVEAWSAVFVSTVVRLAAIENQLEMYDGGSHRGKNVLLRVSNRHSDYVKEARTWQKEGKKGGYQAFPAAGRAIEIGDIIVQDRTAILSKAITLRDTLAGRELHGDIVTGIVEHGGVKYAETIGGNVRHSVRRRRFPLNDKGHLILAREQRFLQEADDGTFTALAPLPRKPSMLPPSSAARIFTVLSLVEECKPVGGSEAEWMDDHLGEVFNQIALHRQLDGRFYGENVVVGFEQPSGPSVSSAGTAAGYGQNRASSSPYADTENVPADYEEKTQETPGQQWLAKAMKEFITYQRQDPERMTDYDAKQYNVQVTSSYAKMYLANPTLFKWAGMAAFASREVGTGMQQAWELGFGTGSEMFTPFTVWVGGIITGRGSGAGPIMGKLLFWALSGGNRVVWADIFWQHVAYRDAGLKALQDARKADDISQRVLDAWTLIDAGAKSKTVEKIWEGNAALLMYEQQEVLQKKIYDAKEVKDLWKAISPNVPSPIPGHGVDFTSYVRDGNIGVFADRWKWILESMLPAWRRLDVNDPVRTRKLIEALK
jgi:monoamine oxidase